MTPSESARIGREVAGRARIGLCLACGVLLAGCGSSSAKDSPSSGSTSSGSTSSGSTSTGARTVSTPSGGGPTTTGKAFDKTSRCSPVSAAVRPRQTSSVARGTVSEERLGAATIKVRVSKFESFDRLVNHFTRSTQVPAGGAKFYAVTYRVMNAGSKPVKPAYTTLGFLLADSAKGTWRTVDREASCRAASDAYSVERGLAFPEKQLRPGQRAVVAAVYVAKPTGTVRWISLTGHTFGLPSVTSVSAVG